MLNIWRLRSVRRKINRGDLIPKPSIADSALVNWKSKGDAGKMIEQPSILRNDDSAPLDEMIGQGFSIIALNCEAEQVLHKDDLEIVDKLEARICSLSTKAIGLLDGFDSAAVLRRHTKSDEALIVVRPDRFIIDSFAPTPEKPQLAWLADAYGLGN